MYDLTEYWHDPQQRPPAAFCRRCGGELYGPGLCCLRCERRREWN